MSRQLTEYSLILINDVSCSEASANLPRPFGRAGTKSVNPQRAGLTRTNKVVTRRRTTYVVPKFRDSVSRVLVDVQNQTRRYDTGN